MDYNRRKRRCVVTFATKNQAQKAVETLNDASIGTGRFLKVKLDDEEITQALKRKKEEGAEREAADQERHAEKMAEKEENRAREAVDQARSAGKKSKVNGVKNLYVKQAIPAWPKGKGKGKDKGKGKGKDEQMMWIPVPMSWMYGGWW